MNTIFSETSQEHTITGSERAIRKVVLPGQTPKGDPILSVLLKRTYDISLNNCCVRAEEDSRLNAADVFFGDPMNTSVHYESDFVPFKIATDLVFVGKAYAPHAKPVQSFSAGIIVGERKKVVRLIGHRVCHFRPGLAPVFSEPAVLSDLELRYEFAYGGVDIYSDIRVPFPYLRNPLGRGFAVKNTEKTIQGLALPYIEDPDNPLTPELLCCEDFTAWEQQPMPAGLGWLPKTWLPRAQFAGVMPGDRAVEQELRQAYTELVPSEHREMYAKTQLPDMDFRFFNGASSGLTFPYLKGDEMIKTANLTPQGQCHFYLPGEQPKIGLDIGEGLYEPEVVLHTVMIRMEDKQVDMVWRGAVPYPGSDWLPKIKKMDVMVQ